MKKILILGAGIYQAPLIKKAKEKGYYVIVASIQGNYPGFKLADKVYYEDTTDAEKILQIAKKESIDGICTTGTDVALTSIGKICDELGLKGISYEAAIKATNKNEMKKAFLEGKVRTARFVEVNSLKDAKNSLNLLTMPLIFKAVDSSGSRGIVIVRYENEIENAYKKVKEVTKLNYFIIEEFIEGEELGAQAFVHNGKIKFIMPHGDMVFKGDAGVPIGHYVPYNFDPEIEKDLHKQLISSIKALGLDNCAVNADFILKDKKIYVLEIGARAGATCLPEMVSIYFDIDYYDLILQQAIGAEIKFKSDSQNPCAAELIISNKSGKINSFINNIIWNKNIEDISFDYTIGDEIKKFKVGPDRIGQVIVKGKKQEQLLIDLKKIKNKIRIVLE